jgi:hypothetical protein
MSKRYPGGLITKTPVTPTTSSAPGVWTLEQALQYIKAGTWPLYVLSDPYFNYVTMLLHGDGTNGAQNNTFLDSSTNNFTITRNGNATQGSFSPYGSNWSNYFDGSSHLTVPANAAFNLTGDFTLELWINPWSNTGSGGYSLYFGAAGGSGDYFGVKSGTNYVAQFSGSGEMFWSGVPTIGAWTHLALVRSGSTVTLYVNGVSAGTNTKSSTWIGSGSNVQIGAFSGAQFFTQAYISNLRLVKGTAVYTSNFTPSTTPLTAIANTSLLTCQSNRFIDSSTNAFAITVNGTPSVQRFSPFSPTAAYSTSTIGGSMYDDGTGDYLYVPSINVSGNWTVEGWFYFTTFASGSVHIVSANNGGTGNPDWIGGQNSSSIGTYLTSWISSGVPFPRNQWCHIATVNNAGTVTIYLNGTSIVSASGYSGYSYSGELIIGSYFNRQGGYYSNVRFSTVARYTGAFTPPTTPFTNDASTYLLTNFTNGGIFDNAMMNNLETVGNAQISTSVVKFGSGSMSFDGTGDYLDTQSVLAAEFGSGDFTIEFWLNASGGIGTTKTVISKGVAGSVGSDYWSIEGSAGGNLTFYAAPSATAYVATTTQPWTSGWAHIAVCRSGANTRMFVNGVQSGSTYSTLTTFGTGGFIRVGSSTYSAARTITGYIDDLRITKGYARYTANFTPPAAAFPNQ